MATRAIEFPNSQGHTCRIAFCRSSSSAQRIPAERLFDEEHRANWHGTGADTDRHVSAEEHCRRASESSRLAREAELSASIVHQLSQPLASMLAHAQAAKRWLSAGTPNLMEAVASLDRISSDARSAARTMERIRALFKHESIDKKEASVPDIVSEAIRLVLEDPNKRGVPIMWHSEQNLPKVCLDPIAIQEVFINLISNAVEALEMNRNSGLIQLQATVNGEHEMLIQVIDNGPGIGETEKIFDAFVTTKKNGLGIGLAVSRSIAEAHGGRLWAENNPGAGARFVLALPLNNSRD